MVKYEELENKKPSKTTTPKSEPEVVDTRWSTYKKRGTIEARPFVDGEKLPEGCSVSQKDKEAKSPQVGDWIARDRDNPEDTWLINGRFFEANYERS